MTDVQRNRNNKKLIDAVNFLQLEFPIKDISERMGIDKGNLSSYLSNRKSVSAKFMEKFEKEFSKELSGFVYNSESVEKNDTVEDIDCVLELKRIIAKKDEQLDFYKEKINFYEQRGSVESRLQKLEGFMDMVKLNFEIDLAIESAENSIKQDKKIKSIGGKD
jgi:transcriptional regulator with XRE-family HTH domain